MRKGTVVVNNVPNDCERFAVARLSEGELWYWGSWENNEEADNVAKSICGIVVDMEE